MQRPEELFQISDDQEIHSVLDAMVQFSDELLLCRTEHILNDITQLNDKLIRYASQSEQDGNNGVISDDYRVLFLYVVEDILSSYKPLLRKQLPDMIRWCVEKDFIMQALTFVTELSPHYFVTTVFKPTDTEADNFNIVLKIASGKKPPTDDYDLENVSKLRDRLFPCFRGSCNPLSSKEKKDYDWFNSGLTSIHIRSS